MNDELDELWRTYSHLAVARIDAIAAAGAALREGRPHTHLLVRTAVEECHKLAGSLDSFGRTGGSALALKAAALLTARFPDVDALDSVVARLRETTGDPEA